ncbi:dTDP-4-dehydrorhamnose 3,5-epimerase [Cupriavidus plantarum]|uniref:dTDP-4-dehydrorhamnose 3,5-epimerase n=1 Tax=Cupriavidus plantarum TaxID=942865 RepID=A0A316F2B2_9BURK|nr:dTDP-4-dehydrorhamnose 3,5-epimerase [Cupriavidus plantarum]PWK38315.1 dTDP-4-dehydrorhamnose 3,5-epimerase [Cupriavidus plantarum]CAG2127491.1 dTDP-4-dehydrorhamnose 3,5-epimerase [Cupriavidus plantarum]SMR67330.1 dTDP-4-dehydrorhamnose 3,5-epimerase [Cupriavidus plantarum]
MTQQSGLIAAPASIADVLILEPRVFQDARGHFLESFNAETFERVTGIRRRFVQDNESRSMRNVLRGLHFQSRKPQGKLVHVTAGEIFDVAVDLRKDSPTFGKWAGVTLSARNFRQLWIPEGFAHGFMVTSDYADVLYKMTDYYDPEFECAIAWNDPDIGIQWPASEGPILNDRDAGAPRLRDLGLQGTP